MKFPKSEMNVLHHLSFRCGLPERKAQRTGGGSRIKSHAAAVVVGKLPSERGRNYTPLGKWCIVPCRERPADSR